MNENLEIEIVIRTNGDKAMINEEAAVLPVSSAYSDSKGLSCS